MDSGNTQMYVEDRIEAPGARPSPGPRTASDRAGHEPTTSEVCQVGPASPPTAGAFPFPCPGFLSDFFNQASTTAGTKLSSDWTRQEQDHISCVTDRPACRLQVWLDKGAT